MLMEHQLTNTDLVMEHQQIKSDSVVMHHKKWKNQRSSQSLFNVAFSQVKKLSLNNLKSLPKRQFQIRMVTISLLGAKKRHY